MRCVVDTNVAMTADGANPAAPASCVAASARALSAVMKGGHVFVDDGRRIVAEYQQNLARRGEPGAGQIFMKWVLTNEHAPARVTRVALTPRPHDPEDFEELPAAPSGTRYDPSDRKFLAVAAAHPERPPVLQSFDSKWWGWQGPLEEVGVTIHFLCPEAIAAKHAEKMT